jgi:hypothetical protein
MDPKIAITKTILISTVTVLVSGPVAHAVDGTYEDAMEVRRLLTVDTSPSLEGALAVAQGADVAETILLPVSRGFNQGGTALCWAYATLNALETIYLVRNPEGPDVELSRRAMQYYQMEDRYRRSIKGVNTYIREGGVALDAVRLIQANGILAFDDYYDITDPYGQGNILTMIDNAESFTEKIVAMYEGMNAVYTAPPTLTHIPISPTPDDPDPAHVEANPGDLARLVLANDMWQSYTPSETEVGFHDHPDPDARWENQSWHMPQSEFPGRIKQALEAGFPVLITVLNHVVLVYGADYDDTGSPIAYYIKDSYDGVRSVAGYLLVGYYFKADAETVHEILWEMTTVKL